MKSGILIFLFSMFSYNCAFAVKSSYIYEFEKKMYIDNGNPNASCAGTYHQSCWGAKVELVEAADFVAVETRLQEKSAKFHADVVVTQAQHFNRLIQSKYLKEIIKEIFEKEFKDKVPKESI